MILKQCIQSDAELTLEAQRPQDALQIKTNFQSRTSRAVSLFVNERNKISLVIEWKFRLERLENSVLSENSIDCQVLKRCHMRFAIAQNV